MAISLHVLHNALVYVLCAVRQALVRSMNSAASQQSFKTSSTSLIDTFRRISLPCNTSVADDCSTAHSSQSPVTTAGYFVPLSGYLCPTGSVKTTALCELQAFADRGSIDHVITQSPDTTDSRGYRCHVETSVQSVQSSSDNSPSLSICTTCGRGCGCQQQSEEHTVCRRMSQDSTSSCYRSSLKVESRSVHDCQCSVEPSSSSIILSSSYSLQQQPQSQHGDIMPDVELFSTPLELSSSLHDLSVAARQPVTGSTADLIEHIIQAVVDAHVDTCLYTSDKVATGLREYELMLSSKPVVS